MTTYKNESLDKINKRDMINSVLSLQSKLDEANKNVLDEICKLFNAFLKFQSELAVSQQVNSLLSNKVANMERQSWGNNQYSRRECLDIIGIPSEVDAAVLEEKVLNIFGKLGCDVPPERIEVCHRMSKKSSTVIVKFTKRKDGQQVWSVIRDPQN